MRFCQSHPPPPDWRAWYWDDGRLLGWMPPERATMLAQLLPAIFPCGKRGRGAGCGTRHLPRLPNAAKCCKPLPTIYTHAASFTAGVMSGMPAGEIAMPHGLTRNPNSFGWSVPPFAILVYAATRCMCMASRSMVVCGAVDAPPIKPLIRNYWTLWRQVVCPQTSNPCIVRYVKSKKKQGCTARRRISSAGCMKFSQNALNQKVGTMRGSLFTLPALQRMSALLTAMAKSVNSCASISQRFFGVYRLVNLPLMQHFVLPLPMPDTPITESIIRTTTPCHRVATKSRAANTG